MNIFVYRPGAIGDTILTLPALEAMRRRWPGCTITFAGNSALLGLLPVDQLLSADDGRLLPLFQEPARPWPGADMHVILARQPRGLPGVRRDPMEALELGVHMADWLAQAIEPAAANCQPKLNVESGEGAGLVIHPGAGSAAKRWPAERFAALARQVGLPVTAVRGPADPPVEMDGLDQLWDSLPLEILARRLKASRLFAGNDSGITHLAAAVGTPTLGLYVSTDPRIWGVRGAHTQQLSGDVSASRALQACRELLSSAPPE